MRDGAPIVVKFGGAALSDLGALARHVQATRRTDAPVAIVASARAGVTDRLSRILARPTDRRMHTRVVAELLEEHPALDSSLAPEFARLERLVARVERSGHPESIADRLLSEGERLSTRWLAAELARRGVRGAPIDADRLGLTAERSHGTTVIRLDRSTAPVRAGLRSAWRRGHIPIVTGYFGRDLHGGVATLGRGGSDYSASAIGAMVGASRVELVKREVAVHTADPRLVPAARPVPSLSYEEAEELAQFGARVLHPLTIEPARQFGVELRVCSLEHPEMVTSIGAGRTNGGTRALTLLGPIRMVRIRVPGGRQRPGVVAEISRRLADDAINLVALYSSSTLLAVAVDETAGDATLRALRPLTGNGPAELDGPLPISLLTIIGGHALADVPRIPRAVLAQSRGMSATPRSVSLAVAARSGRACLRLVHRELVERGPE